MKKFDESSPLISFPCHFPIKVIGGDDQDFYDATETIMIKHNQENGVDIGQFSLFTHNNISL